MKIFKKIRSSKNSDMKDLVIIGTGPAGIAAGIEALKHNFSFTILESSKKFSTIENFPKGKPIFAEPSDLLQESELKITDGSKESLLDDIFSAIKDAALPIEENVMVKGFRRKMDFLKSSLRIIILKHFE
jgi:hypothetical protein